MTRTISIRNLWRCLPIPALFHHLFHASFQPGRSEKWYHAPKFASVQMSADVFFSNPFLSDWLLLGTAQRFPRVGCLHASLDFTVAEHIKQSSFGSYRPTWPWRLDDRCARLQSHHYSEPIHTWNIVFDSHHNFLKTACLEWRGCVSA